MKKGWRIVLIIVLICVVFGMVCAGVGLLTGADGERISSIIARRCEERYNLDLDAFIHQWIPEVIQSFRSQVA